VKIREIFKRKNGANYTLPGRSSRFRAFIEDTRVAGMVCVDSLKRKQNAFRSVGIWLLCCVAAAVIPIGVRWIVDKAMNEPFIWDNGELLAVSIGLLGDSVAVLWISRTINANVTNTIGRRLLRLVLSIGAGFVFSVLMIVLAVLATHPKSLNENFITLVSWWLFVFTVLAGVMGKWMEG